MSEVSVFLIYLKRAHERGAAGLAIDLALIARFVGAAP